MSSSLAKSLYNYCKQEIQKCLSENIKFELRLFTTSFPENVLIQFYKDLHEYCLSLDKNIQCETKISKPLYDSFSFFPEDWADTKDRLTHYRNLKTEKGYDGLVIVLSGIELALDKGGLSDFHIINEEIIWKDYLKESICKWFAEKPISLYRDDLDHIDKLFNALFQQTSVNLMKTSEFIDKCIDKSCFTKIEIVELLFESLHEWGLPVLLNYSGKLNEGIRYIKESYKFINFLDFMDKSKIGKAIDKIKLQENNIYIPETIGEVRFNNSKDFVDTVQCFIIDHDSESRKVLMHTDISVILDILRKKEPKRAPSKKVIQVRGPIIQALYSAIWNSLCKTKHIDYSSLHIDIKLHKFIHNYSDFDESKIGNNEEAYEIFKQVFSGLEVYMPTIDSSSISINFINDFKEDQCFYKRNSSPYVEFSIIIKSAYEEDMISDYRWDFNELNFDKINLLLFKKLLLNYQKHPDLIIPVFTIPTYRQMYLAKNEDDGKRVFLAGIDSLKLHNLIGSDILNDSSMEHWKTDLVNFATEYKKFIFNVNKNGLYKSLNSSFSNLISYTEVLYKKALTEQNGEIVKFMYDLGLILENKPDGSYSDSVIVSILSPIFLQIFYYQTNYLRNVFEKILSDIVENELQPLPETYLNALNSIEVNRSILGVVNRNNKFDAHSKSFNNFFFIGRLATTQSDLLSRSLLQDDFISDDDVSDKILFENTTESIVYKNLLDEYLKINEFAKDGLKIGILNYGAFQRFLSGLHEFLNVRLNERGPEEPKFNLHLTVYNNQNNFLETLRLLKAWKERWEYTDESIYINANIYLSVKHVEGINGVEEVLEEDDSCYDLFILNNFLETSESDDKLQNHKPFKIKTNDANFYSFPWLESPKPLKRTFFEKSTPQRERLLSNRRLTLVSLHSDISYRVINSYNHIEPFSTLAFSVVDYNKWEKNIEIIHSKSNWVVCIDPAIDKDLVVSDNCQIIGFSSGVGVNGDNNITISTTFSDLGRIEKKITHRLKILFSNWEEQEYPLIAKEIINNSKQISGLSLVKATGPSEYIRDVIAYGVTRKIKENCDPLYICDELISLDSYKHWFKENTEPYRPDLLHLKAMVVDGEIIINATIIECKIAKKFTEMEKAQLQVRSGLKHLTHIFDNEKCSIISRIWWAQLQRLICAVSKIENNDEKLKEATAALERFLDGEFKIKWAGEILYFLLDDNFEVKSSNDYYIIEGKKYTIQTNIIPPEIFKNFCLGNIKQIYDNDIECETIEWIDEVRHVQNIENGSSNLKQNGESTNHNAVTTQDDVKQKPLSIKNGLQNLNETQHNTNTNTNTNIDIDINNNEYEKQLYAPGLPNKIFLGTSTYDEEPIFWEFGHKELPNRHLLIFGRSGQGKTYAIQGILAEFAKNNLASLIIDYTDGFTKGHLDTEFKEMVKIRSHVIKKNPLGINPFKCQSSYDDDLEEEIIESAIDVATRVMSVFSSVYTLGDQQKAFLTKTIEQALTISTEVVLADILELLEKNEDNSSKTLANKIYPFVQNKPFDERNALNWSTYFDTSIAKVQIIQLAHTSSEFYRLFTEFVLWDLFSYAKINGSPKKPIPVVLDEIQNLDHAMGTPLSKILTEGRKFGFCGIFATQTLSNLKQEERDRLFQAAHKLYFAPVETEVNYFAKLLADSTSSASKEEWVKRLTSLKKGECYSVGYIIENGLLKQKYKKIKVSTLEYRFENE